jgi:hypothetical protein
VLGVSMTPLYAILIFDFGTVPTERHCLVQIGFVFIDPKALNYLVFKSFDIERI